MTPNGQNMPVAEVAIDAALVRRLLADAVQHDGLDPVLADRPLTLMANGWDNVMFRLGSEHLVRLPRREVAVPLVINEQRWLPELSEHFRLPLPVPVPVFAGAASDDPSAAYRWPWSIVPWFAGEALGSRVLTDREASNLAADLAGFFSALHQPAPVEAPSNPFRGVPLAERAHHTAAHLEMGSPAMDAAGSATAAAAIRAHWADALHAPVWDRKLLWIHGDVHALNLLWHGGRLSAVIDFGDITAGDPATDLAVAWSLFPNPEHRARFQQLANIGGAAVDSGTWARARGWALGVAAAIVSRSADNPILRELGTQTLRAVAEDQG